MSRENNSWTWSNISSKPAEFSCIAPLIYSCIVTVRDNYDLLGTIKLQYKIKTKHTIDDEWMSDYLLNRFKCKVSYDDALFKRDGSTMIFISTIHLTAERYKLILREEKLQRILNDDKED